MKHYSRLISIFLLFQVLFAVISNGQEIKKDTAIHEINGRHFYQYIVQPGNTLYSIARAYSITVQEVEEFNPDAKSGLSIGDTLFLPAAGKDKVTIEKRLETDANVIVHEVQKKQTLYAISKIYDVRITDIISENPDLEDGLTEGQFIRIPVGKMKQADTLKKANEDERFIRHEVKTGETIFSLSQLYGVHPDSLKKVNGGLPDGLKTGSIILVPRQRRQLPGQDSIPLKKDIYNVVYIMPLFLDINDTLMAHLGVEENERVTPKSLISLQFYEGAMLALDSLRSLGYKFNVRIYDSAKDSSVVDKLINNGDLENADLIIGPFFLTEFMRVSAYARHKQIHTVCPVPQNNKVLLGNPYVSKVAGSRNVMSKNAGKYVATVFRTQNIVMIGASFRANALAMAFRNEFLTTLEKGGDTSSAKNLQDVKWDGGSVESLKAYLKKDVMNIIVVQSDDQVYVSELLAGLSLFHKDHTIRVIGIDQWLKYTNIDFEYYENLGLMVPVDGNVNHSSPEVQNFIRKFHARYDVFPEKFSYQGFDITFYYLNLLQQYGRRFESDLLENSARLLYYKFKFFNTGIESGFENGSTLLLEQNEYELREVVIPD